MNLFDPQRPRLGNGSRCLLSGGAAPTLYLTPKAPGKVQVMVFLLVRGSSYRDYICSLDREDLSTLLQQWEEDPELVLQRYFHYQGPSAELPRVTSVEQAKSVLQRLGLISAKPKEVQ